MSGSPAPIESMVPGTVILRVTADRDPLEHELVLSIGQEMTLTVPASRRQRRYTIKVMGAATSGEAAVALE